MDLSESSIANAFAQGVNTPTNRHNGSTPGNTANAPAGIKGGETRGLHPYAPLNAGLPRAGEPKGEGL